LRTQIANEYNYDAFSKRSSRSLFRNSSNRAGTKASDFSGQILDGSIVRLSDLLRRKSVVMQFGCSTCPPFLDSLCRDARSFVELYNKYRDKGFQFFIIYTRETHPGENIQAHKTFGEKKKHAKMLREEYGLEVPIMVDNLDGAIHRAFGIMPNMVYVIGRDGIIVYRSEWFDGDGLERVLMQMSEIENPSEVFDWGYSEYVRARERTDVKFSTSVYARAGKKALRDAHRILSMK
jgi:peroxiredoxin